MATTKTEAAEVATTDALLITKENLRAWEACSDGYKWFLSKFPQSAAYTAVQRALREDKRFDDAGWLTNKVFANLDAGSISALAEAEVADALDATKYSPNSAEGNYSTAASSGDSSKAASSGNYSKAASSGNYSKAASSGNYSTAASSGYSSTAASSGESSTAASSGDSSKAASSGNYSKAASSGNYSTAASSGDSSKAQASGMQTVAMVAGLNGRARAGEKGAFALAWKDGEQMRITVGIVGEDGIKADTWYRLDDDGKLVEAE